MPPQSPVRVAVVGGGPAGIYAADNLIAGHDAVSVDIIEKLPAPFGLVRYGVAPDHPRIKEIIKALDRVLAKDRIRYLGNVTYGVDVKLSDLRQYYHAVIFATGANADRDLDIPGIDLPESYGAADFVSWYDGHPDYPTTWPLEAESVAIIGAGNVALDIARMLAKPVEEQMSTEICDSVAAGLAANKARDIHIIARRGPAQVKFTPLELRELAHSPSVDVLVDEEGFVVDESGQATIAKNKSVRLVVDTLLKYAQAEPTDATRRIHIHLCSAPVEVLGEDHVTGVRIERTQPVGLGQFAGTGAYTDLDVQAVYRAVGYRSSPLAGLPFDEGRCVVPNVGGRVVDCRGEAVPGVYVTGWLKRGPVGLIGHTKSDAAETVGHLLADLANLPSPDHAEESAITNHLTDCGVQFTTTDGWRRLDAHERALGEATGRERVKVMDRSDMIRISREEGAA